MTCGGKGIIGNIHRGDRSGSRHGAVQCEGAGMGKAVQYPVIFCDGPDGFPIVFLIQKVSGLLPVKVVHVKQDPVFPDGHMPVTRAQEEACGLLQTLFTANGKIITFIDPPDLDPFFVEYGNEHGVDGLFALFHAITDTLRYEDIFKPVHGQTGQAIGFAEHKPAAGEILSHDCETVIDGVTEPAFPEGFLESVVGVTADDAYPQFGVVIVETGTQPAPFLGIDIHDIAVLDFANQSRDLVTVDPGMTSSKGTLSFFGDLYFCIRTFGHMLLLCELNHWWPRHSFCRHSSR